MLISFLNDDKRVLHLFLNYCYHSLFKLRLIIHHIQNISLIIQNYKYNVLISYTDKNILYFLNVLIKQMVKYN
jgi:hypothetical protein